MLADAATMSNSEREESSPEMIISSPNDSKSSDSSPNSDTSNLSQDGSVLGMLARTQDVGTTSSSGTTSMSYNVKLTDLLPREIPPATLLAVDDFEKLLTTTVTEKIQLYRSQEHRLKDAKVSATIVDFSFPKSYADPLKNNRSLIATIIKQIFTFIETTTESRLILPEVGIDTLLYLCTQKNILEDVTQCTSIEVHFSAESWVEIQNNIREVISYFKCVSPTSVDCIPSKNLPFKTSRNRIRNLKLISEFAGIEHLTYDGHNIIGENNNLDHPDSSNGESLSPPRKKIKKPKLKLISVPGKSIKNSLFTFDSLQCGHLQNDTGEPFAAYSYWQLGKVHESGNTGVGTTVAIVDSGIDPAHPSFNKGNIRYFEDYSGDPNINTSANTNHGTLCAGIVGGNHSPQYPECPRGVAPGTKLAIYKIISTGERSAMWYSIYQALEHIIGRQDIIDVVSLSLGSLQFIPEIAGTGYHYLSKQEHNRCMCSLKPWLQVQSAHLLSG